MKSRLANRCDLDSVVEILCEGFHDEAGFCWSIRRADSRARWLKVMMKINAELALDYGLLWVVAEEESCDLAAVAIWYPACHPFPPPWYRIPTRLVWPLLPLYFQPLSLWRLWRLYNLQVCLKPNHLKQYWYLAALATRAGYRRRGMGSHLVSEGLVRATAERTPVFLQAWSHIVPYYERLGFASVSQFLLPGVSETCHGMVWRPPCDSNGS